MSEIKWIKLSTDIFNDDKVRLIRAMPEGDAMICTWFELLCLTGRANQNGLVMMNDKLAYTEPMLSTIFNRSPQIIQMALETFESLGMLERVGKVYAIADWGETQNVEGLEKVKEQTRKRVANYRAQQKAITDGNATCNVTCNATVTQCNATEEEEETELITTKSKRVRKPKAVKRHSQELIDRFEALWDLYPRKEGKSNAMAAYAEAVRAGVKDETIAEGIKNYIDYIENKPVEPQYIKMGSSYFNQHSWDDCYTITYKTKKREAKRYDDIN